MNVDRLKHQQAPVCQAISATSAGPPATLVTRRLSLPLNSRNITMNPDDGRKRNVLPALSVVDLTVGCVLGGIFLALAVVDLSVSFHDRASELLPLYLTWKTSAPILGPFMLLMALALPLELIRAIKEDVIGLFSRPEGRMRHAIGSGAFALLCTLVGTVIAVIAPLEQLIAKSPSASDFQIAELQQWYSLAVFANMLSLFFAISKYWVSQVPGAPTQEEYANAQSNKTSAAKPKEL